jgi:hypothetical protein
MAPNVEVPLGLTGYLTKAGQVGFCMDDVTHLIHTLTGATRIRPRNEQAEARLKEYEDGKTLVTVMGITGWGAECMRLSVYSVEPASTYLTQAGPIDSWPW